MQRRHASEVDCVWVGAGDYESQNCLSLTSRVPSDRTRPAISGVMKRSRPSPVAGSHVSPGPHQDGHEPGPVSRHGDVQRSVPGIEVCPSSWTK